MVAWWRQVVDDHPLHEILLWRMLNCKYKQAQTSRKNPREIFPRVAALGTKLLLPFRLRA